MKAIVIIGLLVLIGCLVWPPLQQRIPPTMNPFAPLVVTDPPGIITRLKMKRLANDPAACLEVLQRAARDGLISYTQPMPMQGKCPVPLPIRVLRFGSISLSSSFLATCPLAVASTQFVLRASKLTEQSPLRSPLMKIEHVGSYACRNIYHRSEGRLSEHATAKAWDITGLTLKNGQYLRVLKNWQQPAPKAALLKQVFNSSCDYFGNSLGPDYNAAHASHFHLGMRGFSICR